MFMTVVTFHNKIEFLFHENSERTSTLLTFDTMQIQWMD